MSKSGAGRNRSEQSLAELKDRVQKATALIAELRESNYALGTEVAELKSRLAEAPKSAKAARGSKDPDPKLREQLDTLKAERKLVRKKVQALLERIEKLES